MKNLENAKVYCVLCGELVEKFECECGSYDASHFYIEFEDGTTMNMEDYISEC